MAEGGRYLCEDACEGLLLLRLELHVEFPGVGGLVGALDFKTCCTLVKSQHSLSQCRLCVLLALGRCSFRLVGLGSSLLRCCCCHAGGTMEFLENLGAWLIGFSVWGLGKWGGVAGRGVRGLGLDLLACDVRLPDGMGGEGVSLQGEGGHGGRK